MEGRCARRVRSAVGRPLPLSKLCRRSEFRRIDAVRGGPKTLIAVLAALLLAAGLAACGDDDGSSSTAAEAGGRAAPAEGRPSGSAPPAGDSTSSGDQGEPGAGGSSDFVPKQHNDSGGGSQQFRVRGGDNSVQEFGEEADASEREAAAAALHNFLDARAEDDWAAACEYLSDATAESFARLAARAEFEDKSCGGVLENLTNPAAKQSLREEAEQADVGSLRMEGERAFVIYTGIRGTILAMPMANEGGAWKVASLAATPLN